MADDNKAERELAEFKWQLEQHQKEREQLFANEALLIGVLQVVSGGSLFGGLAQMASLKVLAGERAYLVFLSLMVIALVLAVFVALWKHDYKKWDVKARAIVSLERLHEAQERSRRANKYLTLMRRGMLAAVLLIAVGFGVLLLAAWSDSFVGAIQAARSWVCPSMPVK